MKSIKKDSFFSIFIKSIKDFEFYKFVKDEKKSNTIKYFIIMIIIYAIISTIGILNTSISRINYIKNLINNEINSLEYSKGTLSINDNKYTSLIDGLLIIDTETSDNSKYETTAIAVLGKEYCSIKFENNILKLRYNDYFYEDINKDDVIKFVSNIGIEYYIISGMIIFLIEIILLGTSTFVDVVIIAIMGYIMSRIIKGDLVLDFKQILKISIHSITLPILLAMIYGIINSFSGFYIKYFSIMYTSIAVIYMMTAIILIASNNEKE